MGIYNEFNKKEKPLFTGYRYGFGRVDPPAADGDGGGGGGFGGFPYVGMVTRTGSLAQSSGLSQTKTSGTAPNYTGRNNLAGQGSIQNRYSIPNPFGSLIPAEFRNTSFTIIEKFYKNSAIGNYQIGGVRASDSNISGWTSGNNTSNTDILLTTRYDNRTGGFSGTWGTNYPNFLGNNYLGTSGNHSVGSLWRGWRSSMLSWDASTGKVWWAGQDDQNSGNPSIIDTGNTRTLTQWQNGVGTQNLIHRIVQVNDPIADWYIIYGKAVNNVTTAAQYNMLSTTVHADPDNA